MRIIVHNHFSTRDKRDAEDYSKPGTVERGFVAKLINPKSGSVVQKSDLFIRRERAEQWLKDQLDSTIWAGKYLIGKVDAEMQRI